MEKISNAEAVDFTDPGYMRSGNELQVRVFGILQELRLMELLAVYDPLVGGTIPLAIDIPGSDVDILCRARSGATGPESFDGLEKLLTGNYGDYPGFRCRRGKQDGKEVLTCMFFVGDIQIEVFAQDIPVSEQNGYRHMLTEYKLLLQEGRWLREKVIELKMQGMKTEPAFSAALGLKGDPYRCMLDLGKRMGLY